MAATYYVANAGNDSNAGTSAAAPFKTISHVVSIAGAGDTVLLNRGDRWYESMAVPHSSITVDAYGPTSAFDGDGYCTNAPILDQGAAVTTWSSYSGGVVVTSVLDTFTGTAGTTLASHTPNIGTSWAEHTHYAKAMQLTASGTVRSTTASTTAVYYCSPANLSADYFVQADVNFVTIVAAEAGRVFARGNTSGNQTFYTGKIDSAGNIAISKFVAGTGSDLVTGTVTAPTANVPITIKLVVQGTALTLYVGGTQQLTTTDSAISATGVAGIYMGVGSGVSDSTNVQMDNFSTGPIDNGSPTNTYQATVTTQPLIVDHNQTYCFFGNTMNTLDDQEYFWYNNILYFRNDAGQPSDTEIVGGARNNGVSATSLSGLTVQNIAVEHANESSYYFNACSGVLLNQCYGQRTSFWNGTLGQNGFIQCVGAFTGATVQGCYGRYIGADGIYFNTGSAPVALYNTFYQIYELVSNGISIDSSTPANTGAVVRGNVIVYPSGQSGYNSNSSKGGVISFSDGTLIERNYIAYGPLFGITMPCNSPIVRDNVLYQCGGGYYYTGILSLNGGGGGLRFATNGGVNISGHQVYRNLCLECPTGIWGYIDSGQSVTSVLIANNVVFNKNTAPATQTSAGADVATGYQIYFSSAGNGFGGTFQNNLTYNAQGTGASLYFQTISGTWASDYNILGPNATGCVNFTGNSYNTLAAYVTGKSKDAHSGSLAPTFVNSSYVPPVRPTPRTVTEAMQAFRSTNVSPARGVGIIVEGIDRPYGF